MSAVRGISGRDLVDRGFQVASEVPGLNRLLARNMGVATVFHQIVDVRRPHEGTAFCNQLRSDFHEVVAFLSSINTPSTDMWITFDDGYAEAAHVLDEIAPRFPDIRFVFFICPEKTAQQVGFRWDAWERQNDAAGQAEDFELFTREPVSLGENLREDLRGAAADERFRMATSQECLALTRHPNVYLGNHSDRHIELSTMNADDAEEEIRRSAGHFSATFGDTLHFAFPYGTPGVSYDDNHVRLLRSLGYTHIWSTEPLGFDPERMGSSVIPRIPVSGLRTAGQTRANVTKYLVKTKLKTLRG